MPTLASAARSALAKLTQPTGPSGDALKSLRAEIDQVDDAILDLIHQRQHLTEKIGRAKAGEDVLRLKPDREAHVLTRLLRNAEPHARRLVLALWREIMAAGLAAQGEIDVLVWPGSDPTGRLDAARRRFGSQARYKVVGTPSEALKLAAGKNALGVLALDPKAPWWIELATRHPELWVFEAIDGPRGSAEPSALCVGRIEPDALAGARTFVVSGGGDAGLGSHPRKLLGLEVGWRLYMIDHGTSPETVRIEREMGVIGRAPRFCLSPEEAIAPQPRPRGRAAGARSG